MIVSYSVQMCAPIGSLKPQTDESPAATRVEYIFVSIRRLSVVLHLSYGWPYRSEQAQSLDSCTHRKRDCRDVRKVLTVAQAALGFIKFGKHKVFIKPVS